MGEKKETRLRRRSKSKSKSEKAEEGRNDTCEGDEANDKMNKRRLKGVALGNLRGIVFVILLCLLATISYMVR